MDVIYAPAKINLFLSVTGKAPHGYHLLEMLTVPLALADVVSVSMDRNNTGFSLAVSGENRGVAGEDLGKSENNILSRTYEGFCSRFDVRCALYVTLQKHIPVGAGLGGGSSDAAGLLKFLAEKFMGKKKDLFSDPALLSLAASLGADVPFFLAAHPCVVRGIGEELLPVKIPWLADYCIELVIPPVQLSTREIFETYSASKPVFSPKRLGLDYDNTRPQDLIHNDLLAPAMQHAPVIGEVIASLRAEQFQCGMTGSGCGIFVICPKIDALRGRKKIAEIAAKYSCRLFSTSCL